MKHTWQRSIFSIWFGQSVSLLTSSIFQMCIVWYLTAQTGSAMVLSVAVIIAYVPQAIIALFTGVVIDRFSRKKIIIFSDLFIAGCSLLLSIAALLGPLPVWLIFLVLGLRSVGSALHAPAVQALTPLIVPKESLTKYAGFFQTFQTVSHLISPGLALFLNSALPLYVIVFFDVIGALVAVVFLAPIKIEQAKSQVHDDIHLVRDLKDGCRAIAGIPGMLAILVVSALYCIVYAPVGTLYPYVAMVYFGGGESGAAVIEIIAAVGSLLGSLALGAFGHKLRPLLGFHASILCYGLSLLLIGCLSPSGIIYFAVLAFFMGVSIPFYYGILNATFQIKIPNEYLGRAFTVMHAVQALSMPFSMMFSGQFADLMGANVLFLILGICAVALAVISYLLPSVKIAFSRDQ